MQPSRRVRTYRTVRLQRPARVVRPREESRRVWTQRRRTFTVGAVGWFVVAGLLWRADEGWPAVGLCLAAGVFWSAAVVKALVLVRRAQDESS